MAPAFNASCTAEMLSKPTMATFPARPADFTAASAPNAMLSLLQSRAFKSGCALSMAEETLLAMSISHCPLCESTIFIPAAFMASSKPSRRCWPLKAVRTPSRMATGSPACKCLARYSPTMRAPARLSGPTNGIFTPAWASTSSSSLLSILTTTIPAAWARLQTVTRTLESAGAITMASTRRAVISSTRATWRAISRSSLIPLTISSY